MALGDLYSVSVVDDIKVIAFRPTQILDALQIERMGADLKGIVDTDDVSRYIFDFSNVTYLSSSALGMLIGLQRRVVQNEGELKLAGIHPDIMEVFRITKLDTVFDIYKTTEAALEAFRKNL
jgi:anti-sigma B factor antagonist